MTLVIDFNSAEWEQMSREERVVTWCLLYLKREREGKTAPESLNPPDFSWRWESGMHDYIGLAPVAILYAGEYPAALVNADLGHNDITGVIDLPALLPGVRAEYVVTENSDETQRKVWEEVVQVEHSLLKLLDLDEPEVLACFDLARETRERFEGKTRSFADRVEQAQRELRAALTLYGLEQLANSEDDSLDIGAPDGTVITLKKTHSVLDLLSMNKS